MMKIGQWLLLCYSKGSDYQLQKSGGMRRKLVVQVIVGSKILVIVGALVGLVLLAGPAMAADELYRYRNAQGTVVIDDHVPPQFIKNGYDVLNSLGQVTEVVPRQLTEDEIKNLSSDEARRRKEEQEKEQQRLRDESLLLRYSDVRDIEAARERSIRELKIRLSIIRGNVLATKSQVERQQAKAADIERNGNKVPESLLENIVELKQEIELAEIAIAQREEEIEKVKAEYQDDIDRFTYLVEVLGYRR
jgi:hypothetical protein